MKKAVFIDRDGTINVNVEYLDNPEDFQMYPGVAEGVKILNENGFLVIVITNQSGIARGYFTKETLEKIHQRMMKELKEKGAKIDAIYYCPHHPDDNCSCRKPETGLLEKAIKEHNIDTSHSYVIGDRMIDVEAGHKIGLKTVLIPERKKLVEQEKKQSNVKPDFECSDFYQGTLWILKQ
jgi:histidinol-phosphate phosphatase family protein